MQKGTCQSKLFDKAHGVSYIVFVCGYGEMADALVSGTSGSNPVQVQVLLSAPVEVYDLRRIDKSCYPHL